MRQDPPQKPEKNTTDRVVYVAKAAFQWGHAGWERVKKHFDQVIAIPCDAIGSEHPQAVIAAARAKLEALEAYDYLISFWNELYFRPADLQKARKGAINIHPAPPEHPGLGMFTFVRLWPEKRPFHGATLHEMDPRLDHGPIYRVVRFPVTADMSDEDLVKKTGDLTLQMLDEACQVLKTGASTQTLQSPQAQKERWSKRCFTAAMEAEWLKNRPAEDPLHRLNCHDGAILYQRFGASLDSLDEV